MNRGVVGINLVIVADYYMYMLPPGGLYTSFTSFDELLELNHLQSMSYLQLTS